MPNVYIELGETCGIEFETENISSFEISGSNVCEIFHATHDASIETDKAKIGPLTVDLKTLKENKILSLLNYNNFVIGTELVSGILNSKGGNFLDCIKELTGFLSEYGEELTGKRSGIHFHFSLPYPNLRILKSILRLGKYLEALFFTVGGMGYEFRGLENDFIYCRPITKTGPVCVPSGRTPGYVQCYNIYDVLKSETVAEFWERYGDLNNHRGRYNPIRYSWLNLYPLFPSGDYKGTLEFRVFNKTLNPKFIYASAMLCRAFVNYAVKSSYNSLQENDLLHENSIYNDQLTKQTIINHLINFAQLSDLEEDVVEILLRIIELSKIPIAEKKYVHTHIRRDLNNYWGNSNYRPEVINSNLIFRPKYEDIHVLRGEV